MVLCLSFGERGEGAKLWKQPDMTLDRVKDTRRAEAETAARALGVHDLVCLDLDEGIAKLFVLSDLNMRIS